MLKFLPLELKLAMFSITEAKKYKACPKSQTLKNKTFLAQL